MTELRSGDGGSRRGVVPPVANNAASEPQPQPERLDLILVVAAVMAFLILTTCLYLMYMAMEGLR